MDGAVVAPAPPDGVKGPYDGRAIGTNLRLLLVFAYFGQSFKDMTVEERQAFVSAINSIRAGDDPGRKYLVDKVMYNYGMQAARLHDPAQRLAVWKACKFDRAAAEALEQSAQCILDLLEATGYSLQSNIHLQEMVAQDWGLEFDPADPAGNAARIQAQVDELFAAAMGVTQGRVPFARFEAAGPGPGRRSYSTRAESAARAVAAAR
jgi:hypothetical protein